MTLKVIRDPLRTSAIIRQTSKVVSRVVEVICGEGETGNILVGQVRGRLTAGCVTLVILLLIF